MKTVKVICGPRERFPGFGAIGQYFLCNQAVTIEVDDKQLAELTSEPASSFLHVEVQEDDGKKKK